MVAQRVTPSEYFGNYTTQNTTTPNTIPQNKDHTALIIFGAICVTAIVAMVLVYLKK